MAPGTTIERLANFVAGLTLDETPPATVRRARCQLASVIAASLGARCDPAVHKIAEAVAARGGEGPCPVWFDGSRASLHDAVLVNAASSCAFDWDEILLLGHPGHSSVGVPVAMAIERGATLGELLVAQIAANELEARLGLACFLGPQNGQHQPYLHQLGAAAAASRMLGLDAEATAHALAISLAQPQTALWPAFLGPIESKVLTAAHATELGLCAAEQAAAGLKGPLDILDHPYGFFSRFSFLPLTGALGGLRRAWLTDTLQVKLHAACWYFQAPLDAAARLVEHNGGPFAPGEIARVRCGATLLATTVHEVARAHGGTRLLPNVVNFRLDFSLGVLLLAGRLSPEELAPEALEARAPELRSLVEHTEVFHDATATREMLVGVHEALELGGLLGAPKLARLLGALRALRRAFPRTSGLSLREIRTVLPNPLAALVGLTSARGRRYDLGDRAEALSELALKCGGDLEVHLTNGRVLTERCDVPLGALSDPAGAGRARKKLDHAVALSGRDLAVAEVVFEAPLDTPATALVGAS